MGGGVRLGLKGTETTSTFDNDFKRLPEDIKELVIDCLKTLRKNEPLPAKLRFNKLSGYKNPNVYAVHVTRNHAYKLTFEIIDGVARLRRVGTHKEIDRSP